MHFAPVFMEDHFILRFSVKIIKKTCLRLKETGSAAAREELARINAAHTPNPSPYFPLRLLFHACLQHIWLPHKPTVDLLYRLLKGKHEYVFDLKTYTSERGLLQSQQNPYFQILGPCFHGYPNQDIDRAHQTVVRGK